MYKFQVRFGRLFLAGLVITTIGGGQALASGFDLSYLKKDHDAVVCYVTENDRVALQERGRETWTLNVKKHSPLDLVKKKRYRHRSVQSTYSVIGKSSTSQGIVCAAADAACAAGPDNELISMATVLGGVIMDQKKGSRMALNRSGLLSLGNILNAEALAAAAPAQNLECDSPESSSTPERWSCIGESGDFLSQFSLIRVNPYKDDPAIVEQCEYFQRSRGETDPEE